MSQKKQVSFLLVYFTRISSQYSDINNFRRKILIYITFLSYILNKCNLKSNIKAKNCTLFNDYFTERQTSKEQKIINWCTVINSCNLRGKYETRIISHSNKYQSEKIYLINWVTIKYYRYKIHNYSQNCWIRINVYLCSNLRKNYKMSRKRNKHKKPTITISHGNTVYICTSLRKIF